MKTLGFKSDKYKTVSWVYYLVFAVMAKGGKKKKKHNTIPPNRMHRQYKTNAANTQLATDMYNPNSTW